MYKKNLLMIMRHAKTEPGDITTIDFDRSLTARGQNQTQFVAKQLNYLGIEIDLAVVSSANRTTQTFDALARDLKRAPKSVFDERLYQTDVDGFLEVIKEYFTNDHSLLVIGHCPTVIEVTEYLTGEYHDFKTAALAILSAKTASLKDSFNRPNQFYFEEMLIANE